MDEEFNNVVNMPKLLLIASQLCNLQLDNAIIPKNNYKYNPNDYINK